MSLSNISGTHRVGQFMLSAKPEGKIQLAHTRRGVPTMIIAPTIPELGRAATTLATAPISLYGAADQIEIVYQWLVRQQIVQLSLCVCDGVYVWIDPPLAWNSQSRTTVGLDIMVHDQGCEFELNLPITFQNIKAIAVQVSSLSDNPYMGIVSAIGRGLNQLGLYGVSRPSRTSGIYAQPGSLTAAAVGD